MRRQTMAVSNLSAQIAFRMRQEINRIADVEQLTVSDTVRALLGHGIDAYRADKGLADPYGGGWYGRPHF